MASSCQHSQFLPPFLHAPLAIYLHRLKNTYSLRQHNQLRAANKLRNTFSSQSIFILLDGPSTSNLNLSFLDRKHVIAVSNTFELPQYPNLRPIYHVFPPIRKYHSQYWSYQTYQDWILRYSSKTGFSNVLAHVYDEDLFSACLPPQSHNIIYYGLRSTYERPLRIADLSSVPDFSSVSELAIHCAIFLGAANIFLIGADLSLSSSNAYNLNRSSTSSIFSSSRDTIPSISSLSSVKRILTTLSGYHYYSQFPVNIFTLNQDSYFTDIFPFISFDEALSL